MVRQIGGRRFVLTPLADSSGWLWHVVPGHPGWKPWGEAPTREAAIEAAEKYISGGHNHDERR